VQRRTLTQPNRYLFDTVEARTELAECIREFQPRILFLPYATDAHPDHVAASAIATAARFYAKFTKTEMAGEPFYPAKVYRYMAVHLSLVVEPSFIVAVEPADLRRKLDALGAYHSQFGANPQNARIVPMMEQLAAVWGSRIGASAGEPFFALEPVGLSSLSALV
jgi:N-acetylglucosamine malate deacetylase 1